MRALGVGWLMVAAAGAVAPRPVAIMIIAVVAIATVVMTLIAYNDRKRRLAVAQWAETGKWLDWREEMRDMDADVEAEWASFVPGGRPLGSKFVQPDRPRTLKPRVPMQRQGRAS